MDSLFLRDVDSRLMPQDDYNHYLGTESSLDLNPKRQMQIIDILDSIPESAKSKILNSSYQKLDYHQSYANVLAEIPSDAYREEWFCGDHCHRCGQSLYHPDSIGSQYDSICAPCDEAMNEELRYQEYGGILG